MDIIGITRSFYVNRYVDLIIQLNNKTAVLLLCIVLVFTVTIMIPNAFAENVPAWVKNTAGWWADDQISETEFVNAIEYLVKEDIIQVNVSQISETSETVPNWIKNTAGWWATDAISETEFVNAIAYLIKAGIISIESSKSPELIAEMWINGHINDDEFLTSIEHLIETKNITYQSGSITDKSDLPDWLVNNAGWWAARILTNSDFNFDPGYTTEEIFPCNDDSSGTACIDWKVNSYGLRGNEFEKEKPDNTFRIFTVGGSTTFGRGENNDDTWPAYLQQIMNEKITNKNVEVINAGIQGADSNEELKLIEQKLIKFSPDLIIIYDGLNDYKHTDVDNTIQNWNHVCKLGKNEGFDTIIIVQPLPSTGHRVLTVQEINSFPLLMSGYIELPYVEISQQYVDAFEELDKVCTKTADFRKIFDYIQAPIFWDHGHTMSFGNRIIAGNVFSVISPIYFDKTYSVNPILSPVTGVVYAVSADLSGRNFDNLDLQNAVFDKADLSNTSFKNTNIDGARFTFANLNNSNLVDRIDLSNINLAGTDLSNTNLKGKNLTGTILTGADLTGTILTEADLTGVNLSFVDLSEHDLAGTNLSDTILFRTNLSGMDLRHIPLANADFRYTVLSESKLPGSLLVNNNFDYAILKNINFAGKDLSGSSFKHVELEGSDMQNIALHAASFVQVDFTKIKNKSLAGSNLSDASFAHSNLSGVNLSDVIMVRTNFWKADLSGVDFTVIPVNQMKNHISGTTFIEANLYNANFEGVNLSPKKIFFNIFKDKAYHIRDQIQSSETKLMMKNDLFTEFSRVLIISAEVSGNDLAVNYIYFSDFTKANLENANFKNASLARVNFYQANLANADLSGADLRYADLSGADLRYADLLDADLSNANLDGAILDGAVLTCKNHSVCN